MGFLTGAYLKMHAARMRIQLQHQLTSITMRYNRVQKQVGEMEKKLTAMQQQQNQVFNAEMQSANAGAYSSIFQGLSGAKPANGSGTVDASQTAALQQANMEYQKAMQQNSVYYTMKKFNVDAEFDQFREMQLEPLKNLEEQLAVEKANLETRVATYKEQEESAKAMEKQDRKDAIADYTGQG